MTNSAKEWGVEFIFDEDDPADCDLLCEITSYRDMWISSIYNHGYCLCICVESVNGINAEYDIKKLAECYSHYVHKKPKEINYDD